MAGAADQLEDELARLQRQRDRYAMAADAATDPKVSVGHLRNVERLDEEIEAIRKALEAMPAAATAADGQQGVTLGFDYEDDDEQTRVFDTSSAVPPTEASPKPAAPLAKPVIAAAVQEAARAPAPAAAPAPVASLPPHVAQAVEAPDAFEISTPFGRRLSEPLGGAVSGPIDLDLPQSGLKKATYFVLAFIVLGAVGAGLWHVFEQPTPPPKRQTESTPTVIESAPVPSDAQHR